MKKYLAIVLLVFVFICPSVYCKSAGNVLKLSKLEFTPTQETLEIHKCLERLFRQCLQKQNVLTADSMFMIVVTPNKFDSELDDFEVYCIQQKCLYSVNRNDFEGYFSFKGFNFIVMGHRQNVRHYFKKV